MEVGPTSEEVKEVKSPVLDVDFEKFDDGDAGLSPLSSQYSSCGESEFDRYCSANSVMGTPSVCSSMGFFHDSVDSDFLSLKDVEGFNLGGSRVSTGFGESSRSTVLDRDRDFGSCSGDVFSVSNDEREGLSRSGDNEGCSSSGNVKAFDSEVGKKENLAVLLKNVESVFLQGAVAARSVADNLLDCNHADEMEDERCREEDESSSRYEHSDGEDSMFNFGSDDAFQARAHYVKNANGKCDEDDGCGNSVLMNPSVAFGSKDWEDFELGGIEGSNGIQIPDNFWEREELISENETGFRDSTSVKSTFKEKSQEHVEAKFKREVTVGTNDLLVEDKSMDGQQSHVTASGHLLHSASSKQIDGNDGSDEYLESCSMYNIFEKNCSPILAPVAVDMGSTPCEEESKNEGILPDFGDHVALQKRLNNPPDLEVDEVGASANHRFDVVEGNRMISNSEDASSSVSSWLESDKGRNHDDLNLAEDKFITRKGKDLEMDAFHDDIVHEMEEILLDSCDSTAMRLKQKRSTLHSKQSSSINDDGSTTTTIDLDDGYSSTQHSFRVSGIEVVGAKQLKGDVSLSERLVGVREYTVYVIRVWSGKNKWEVERRYRDFYTLYRRLKTYFDDQEWVLPPPWSFVEKESRKLFGNASPHVVSERSTLIQECLSSVLQSTHFSSLPSALVWFLSPPNSILTSSQSNDVGADLGRVSTLGKTISLVVDLHPHKSVKELLEKQRYTCAGCHTEFDSGKTRMQEFVLSFGWGKPRLCEYTGQLFCSSCHKNETAVLPARVLHHWDFTPYPVSQLAKSFLDSIVDKPMLCVSAANPFLFSKVPNLLHIVGVRRKIGTMLPHIRCTYRRSVYGRLGYQKYLLETNDFFALRDLIDLSKGVFAALPSILEAVLKKMQEHITELCLECCDNGIPCGARHACSNPSSLIFPFQGEQEIQRCKSCTSVFHKECFTKLAECPCGVVFSKLNTNHSLTKPKLGNAGSETGSSSAKKLDVKSPVEFISNLFSMSKQEKMKDPKDGENVILMGSLPSNSL
ncbi:hypothetical protein RND81_02G021700 [Saponaria officinalis]|uniref:PX domain-containing protein n=1 Tax=Saponaria officinalis TaxID=3572 RepID=A0AAW1MJZ8_SAPOF